MLKSMSDLGESVAIAFERLIESGLLAIIADQYDEKAFGNAIVVLAGANLRIRIVRDRGDIYADASSVSFPDDWAPLERTLLAVGARIARREGLLSPEDAATLVEQNFPLLDIGLSEAQLDETRTRLAEMKRFKKAEALRRLKRREV